MQAAGSVTYQNQPVAGANVIFYPITGDDTTLACQATTDDAGKFSLSTQLAGGQTKAGVAPGEYKVAITKFDMTRVTSTTTPPKNVLPRIYANPKTSKLSANVRLDGENNFDFPLKPE